MDYLRKNAPNAYQWVHESNWTSTDSALERYTTGSTGGLKWESTGRYTNLAPDRQDRTVYRGGTCTSQGSSGTVAFGDLDAYGMARYEILTCARQPNTLETKYRWVSGIGTKNILTRESSSQPQTVKFTSRSISYKLGTVTDISTSAWSVKGTDGSETNYVEIDYYWNPGEAPNNENKLWEKGPGTYNYRTITTAGWYNIWASAEHPSTPSIQLRINNSSGRLLYNY